jgi:hypothetical protein
MSHSQDYYANYGGLEVADYVERYIRGSVTEMQRMRRTVELIPSDVSSLLDVGAGHGIFLEELKAARDISGVGVEITSAKVDYARTRGIDLRLGDASALDFRDREFDAVVSCEVLEHLPFGVYESALAEFARVARRWVIITVPFDEQRRFLRCPYCCASVNPDYHFRAFRTGSLQGLLPGFRLEQTLQLGWRKRSMLIELGRRLVERWPRFLVCPCCGFHDSQGAASTAVAEQSSVALARKLVGWLPARGKPVWLVGVFRRDAADA